MRMLSGPRRRTIAAVLAATGGVWLALAGTLPATVGRTWPDLALAVRPFSATALAARAEALTIRDGITPAALADARRAVAHDPTSIGALLVLAGDPAIRADGGRVRRILAYSESLSRRDLPTQLALIEQRVTVGDVVGALVHYDRALRSSRSATPLLIPVLVQASGDPRVAAPLAALIARRPIWWRALASGLLAPGPHDAAIPAIFRAARLDVAKPEEASLLSEGLNRLVASGRYGDASALLRWATGRAAGGLRNGGFEDRAAAVLAPFDWSLADDADIAASIEPSPDDPRNRVLLLVAARAAGSAARQLMMLAPGGYRLSFVAGGLPSDSGTRPPLVAVRCANRMDPPLASLPFAAPAVAGRFVVPGDCPAQWISVEIAVPVDGGGTPWLDAIRVTRDPAA